MHTAYNHVPTLDANIHFDNGHIDVQLHFVDNDIVHDIYYRIDLANRMDCNDILENGK